MNISHQLGRAPCDPTPTRAVATADVLGTVASTSRSPASGDRPSSTPTSRRTWALPRPEPVPARRRRRYARARASRASVPPRTGRPSRSTPRTHPDLPARRRQRQRGKRSFEVSFGLGSYTGPVRCTCNGSTPTASTPAGRHSCTPGTHNLMLTSTATEVAQLMTAIIQSPDGAMPPGQPAEDQEACRPPLPGAAQLRDLDQRVQRLRLHPAAASSSPGYSPLFARHHRYTTGPRLRDDHAPGPTSAPGIPRQRAARPVRVPAPAHITALAVNMLLYANNQFWPVVFGVVVGGRLEVRPAGADRRADAALHEPVQPRHHASACSCSPAGSASPRRTCSPSGPARYFRLVHPDGHPGLRNGAQRDAHPADRADRRLDGRRSSSRRSSGTGCGASS